MEKVKGCYRTTLYKTWSGTMDKSRYPGERFGT